VAFFWLNFHVHYSCRHSGACCSSGWPIPVERERVIAIQSLLSNAGDAWLLPATGAPDAVAGTLAMQATGHCVFHGSGGCGVYAARPVSCAHFPYVCLIDQRGVHVTLSHYCPTAAAMLFEEHGPTAIVEGPPPVTGLEIPEGLDARDALPPLESPNRLMTFEAVTAWERQAVATRWSEMPEPEDRLELFDRARAAVPQPLEWSAAPDDVDRGRVKLVAPSIGQFARVIDRYLSAKAFASWALYAEDGTAAVLRSVETARAVLEVEAVRACARAGRRLDAPLLTEAIRQSDLLLMHYADRERLDRTPEA
jgi:Fe-S-cluster containining protein